MAEKAPLLRADALTRRFGGLTAVNTALDGIVGQTIVHVCFGYAAIIHQRPSGYSFLSELAQCTAHQISIETAQDSWLAIKSIDDSLNQVNSARATLGAVQGRFENAAANIAIQAENTASARGRIVDADFAMETANLSKAQILQQAGTAMVAQANQLPQQVLSLLR